MAFVSSNAPPEELDHLFETFDRDYFRLLGVPRAFDVDLKALSAAFFEHTKKLHPDRLARAPDHVQAFALRASAVLNKAYDTLRNPVPRAEYLLAMYAGKTAAEDKRVPQELLGQMMMLREEIEEARAANDEQSIIRIRDELSKQRNAVQARIAGLCRELDENKQETRDELRLELNSMKYLDSLLAQL